MGRLFVVGACVVVDWWSVCGGGGDVACGVMGGARNKHDNKTRVGQIHTWEFFLIKDNRNAILHVRNADRAHG